MKVSTGHARTTGIKEKSTNYFSNFFRNISQYLNFLQAFLRHQKKREQHHSTLQRKIDDDV